MVSNSTSKTQTTPIDPSLASPLMTVPPKQKESRFSVSLTKEEIEKDFIKLIGAKPPKLKKRSRLVQKQLEGCFPGMYLASSASELFRILDPPL